MPRYQLTDSYLALARMPGKQIGLDKILYIAYNSDRTLDYKKEEKMAIWFMWILIVLILILAVVVTILTYLQFRMPSRTRELAREVRIAQDEDDSTRTELSLVNMRNRHRNRANNQRKKIDELEAAGEESP